MIVLIHNILLVSLLLSLSYKLSRGARDRRNEACLCFQFSRNRLTTRINSTTTVKISSPQQHLAPEPCTVEPHPHHANIRTCGNFNRGFYYRMLNVSMGHASLWTKAKETRAQSKYVSLQCEIGKTFLMQNLF